MSYDNAEPKVLKTLNSDGQVLDDAGNVINDTSDYWLQLYKQTEPKVDKILKSDGTVVDAAGNLIQATTEFNVKKYNQAEPIPAKYLHADGTIDENSGSGSSVDLEDNHQATINVSTYTEPVEVEPEQGKDGMKKATITLSNIPDIPDIQENKAQTINVSTYTEPVEVEPEQGKDAMAKATITLSDIPQIESNKAATIDVSQYSQPVQITPTSGNDGMAKTTVTLTNIPVPGVTKLYGWTNNMGFGGMAYTTSYPPTNGQTAYYTSTGGQAELRSMRITQVVSDDEFIANGINFERINDYYDITF